ncbi:MAG: YeeE/YedE thiosulfate transporter family protein [Gemmatimonadota bacterium]
MTSAASPIAQPNARAVTPARAPSWLRLGIIFGLVSAVSILLWGPIGVSGTYPRFVGWVLDFFSPAYVAANPYLVKMGSVLKPETFLVIGLLIGGFLASRIGGGGAKAPACEMVHARETSTGRRYFDAFLGGFLILFGARLAGGCTSGHIISGITQLSISSMIFAAGTFASGIVTAMMIRSKEGA